MEVTSSLPAADQANPRKSRRRKQIIILIVCVLIATALWFLRALENEYTTLVDHPLRYINMPDKMISLDPLPQKISLEVKGLGFSVLWHNWIFSKTPLTIDFRKLKSVPTRRKKGFVEYLPMNQYFIDFSNQLTDLEVVAIIPDTLRFRMAVKRTILVPVVPTFNYESGYPVIADSLVRVSPVSVELEGPDLILDTVHFIRALPIKLNRQGASFSRSVGLEEIHKLVKAKPEKVIVTISQKFPN